MKTIFSIGLLIGSLTWASGDPVFVYAPGEAASTPGDSKIMADHWVYQQLFDASLFASIAPGGGALGSFSLRSAAGSTTEDFDLNGIVVEFSTTPRTVNSLSPVFSENTGKDVQSYWAGQSVIFSPNVDIDGNRIWSPSFSVSPEKSFLYNPTKGNLLMTIYNLYVPNVGLNNAFDGVRGSGTTASVQGYRNSTSGVVRSEGLTVKFAFFNNVPEPSTLAMLGVGLVGMCIASRRTIFTRKPVCA